MAVTFDFRVLGPVDVRLDGAPGPHLPPIQRRLLAVLLARAGGQFTPDELVDAVWSGDSPRSAHATLQVHVHRLRRALGDSAHIARGASGYRIDVQTGECDALRFAALVGRARREKAADPEAAVESLRRALALWRGEAYADVEGTGLVAAEARRLEEERLVAFRELQELRLDLGRHDETIGPLAETVRSHPYHERLAALLMLALYRAGRQADSLEVFRSGRKRLVADLGVEPGELLKRVHGAVLRADERLADVAAGSLDGDWTAAQAPSELPMAPHGFIGRERELAALDEAFEAASPIAVVTGMGGIGKTSLAVHWGHNMADRFPDGALFIDLRGQGDSALDPFEALTAMLGSLGVPPGQVPPETDRAAARYRSRIGDKRMLIVLDNAASAAQVRHLLPGGRNCMTLITSRHRLTDLMVRHGGTRIGLDPLLSQDARSLIGGLLPKSRNADEAKVAELAELCGRLPLALQIAAANLSDNPHYSLETYIQRLSSKDPLSSLQLYGSDDAAIRAVFESTYRNIPDDARTMFRLLSLVPGQDFTAAAAASLADWSYADAECAIDDLVSVHLVDHWSPGRFRLHDLLRHYAEECARAEDDPARLDGAAERLLEWYLHRADACRALLYPESTMLELPAGEGPGFEPTAAEAGAWLVDERGNLTAAIRRAVADGRAEAAWSLNDALGAYLWLGVHSSEALSIGRAVLEAAEAAGDPLGRAATELGLAWTLLSANRAAEAIEHGQSAAALAAKTDSVAARAAVDHALALAYASTGRPRDAVRHAQEALRANRDRGRVDLQLEHLEALAGITLQLGEIDTSVELFEEERRLAAVHEGPPSMTMLPNLAAAYTVQGRLDRARATIGMPPDEGKPLMTDGPVSSNLRIIARIHRMAGEFERALTCATAFVEGLGPLPTKIREATAASTLAEVKDAVGEHGEAVVLFDHAVDLTREGWFYFRVDARLGRSAALLHLGEVERSRADADWSLRAARDSGYRVLEGQALNRFAEIAIAESEFEEAAGLAEEALRLGRSIGHRPGMADSLRLLAEAKGRGGDSAAAGRFLDEALELCAEMGMPMPR